MRKKAEALKASKNLISAIEQGIITEQTKVRLKELEIQISQYDFDIEQVKQRTYSYVTPELMMDFFRKAVRGDIKSNEVRRFNFYEKSKQRATNARYYGDVVEQ